MKKIYFIILLSVFSFFFAGSANAAQLFLQSDGKSFAQGQEFLVSVYLNAQGESVNAVEGGVRFPVGELAVKEVRDGNSILNFWIARPAVDQSGVINFSGIVPGGFTGKNGLLFSAVFVAQKSGSGTITISSAKVLKDDGQGTAAHVSTVPLVFLVYKDGPNPPKVQALQDVTAPETFRPEISSSQDLFGGKWFVAFAAQDKGSGIDHYEIMESAEPYSFNSLFDKPQWVSTQSPYVLQDQSLQSIVDVKAVDKSGNETVVEVGAKNFVPLYENYIVWGIIILLGIVFILYKLLWLRKKPQF